MTVAELINELEQIEDKSVEVIMASNDCLPIKEVWILPDEVWLCNYSNDFKESKS